MKKSILTLVILLFSPSSLNANWWKEKNQILDYENRKFKNHVCVSDVLRLDDNKINCRGTIIELNSQGQPIGFFNPNSKINYDLVRCSREFINMKVFEYCYDSKNGDEYQIVD